MRVDIIRIGNSKGLRIPKSLLEQCEIKGSVDLRVEDRTLIVTPYKNAREGWEESFQRMVIKRDDKFLDISDASHSWDKEEWEW